MNAELKLVEVHGEKLTTTSLLVAEKFKKTHFFVTRKIENLKCSVEFRLANFTSRDYIDSRGKSQKLYEITEEGFMFIAMSFTGKEAIEWQEKFIGSFQAMRKELDRINKQKTDPAWKLTRDETKVGFRWMNDNLKEMRESKGKQTASVHYMSEAKLINGVLTGNFSRVNRDSLSATDLQNIAELQRFNAKLIAQDIEYKTRKQELTTLLSKRLTQT